MSNYKCKCGEFWNGEPVTETVLKHNPFLPQDSIGKIVVYCSNGHWGIK